MTVERSAKEKEAQDNPNKISSPFNTSGMTVQKAVEDHVSELSSQGLQCVAEVDVPVLTDLMKKQDQTYSQSQATKEEVRKKETEIAKRTITDENKSSSVANNNTDSFMTLKASVQSQSKNPG